MKKILFITPYPEDRIGSQRFRFEQYYGVLEKKKISINKESFYKDEDLEIIYGESSAFRKMILVLLRYFSRLTLLFKSRSFDFIFIHREVTPIGPPVFEFILSKLFHKKIIYDFDDAIWLNDPNENSFISSILKSKWKVKHIIKWSYKISCGNTFLAEYAYQYNNNVFLNPTTIDVNYHLAPPKQSKANLIIGWTGTHTTLQYLDGIVKVLKTIQTEYAIKIIIISNKAPNFTGLDFDFISWNRSSEIEDLNKIDIGIMPLTHDLWSEGKCGFKILQYMALGIPCIASHVGVNTEIITDGQNGFLCNNSHEWLEKLRLLIENDEKRKIFGARGKKLITEKYSSKSNKDNFLALFEAN